MFEDVSKAGKQGEEIEKFQYSADVRIKCGKFHVAKMDFKVLAFWKKYCTP